MLGGSNQMRKNMALPKYCILDLETSIKNRGEDKVGNMKASPFHPDNQVVMYGFKYNHDARGVTVSNEPDRMPTKEGLGSDYLLVGHNIKFDLLYLYRNPDWRKWVGKGKIWDTMVVEYLITGQQTKYASLDSLSEKYGGHLKPDAIKEYWANNIDTEDIPEDELADYLKGDLENTEIVFKAQYDRAKKLNMLPLIESQMVALLATTEMEWNGFYFDIAKAYEQSKDLHIEQQKLEALLIAKMNSVGIHNPNPASNDHISLYLFGGKQKIQVRKPKHEPDDPLYRYKGGAKAGEIRTVLMDHVVTIPPPQGRIPPPEWKTKKVGFYRTGEEELKEWGGEDAELILRLRGLNKDIGTYYVGYAKQYWPNDKCIHGTFSHTATNTGRLSSSKPNLQNLTNKNGDD